MGVDVGVDLGWVGLYGVQKPVVQKEKGPWAARRGSWLLACLRRG